jgi:hypothetical protein
MEPCGTASPSRGGRTRNVFHCGQAVTATRARAISLGFTQADLAPCFRDKDQLTFEQFLHVIDRKTTGALRTSIGLATTFGDIYAYERFAEAFIDEPVDVRG